MSPNAREVDAFYRSKDADASYRARWSVDRPLGAYYRDTVERTVRRAADRLRAARRVAEVGCGEGVVLRAVAALGVPAERLIGIERSHARLARARADGVPGRLACGDATSLPLAGDSIDVLLLFTVMSSLPAEDRPRAAREIQRVLTRTGAIVWYDYRHTRTGAPEPPWGVTLDDLRALFPHARLDVRRAVAPVRAAAALVRAGVSPHVMDRLPRLTSHLVGMIDL